MFSFVIFYYHLLHKISIHTAQVIPKHTEMGLFYFFKQNDKPLHQYRQDRRRTY